MHSTARSGAATDPLTRILATGIGLALFLSIVRAGILQLHRARSVSIAVKRAAIVGYYDVAYAVTITAVFLALALLLSKSSGRARARAASVFLAVAVFSLIVALVNVGVLEAIRRPLTYQWLSYSDFLRSRDAQNAIAAGLTVGRVLLLAGAVALFLLTARLFARALGAARGRFGSALFAAAAIAAVGYFLAVGKHVPREGQDRHELENPVVYFGRSLWVAHRSPALWTMPTSAGIDDFAPSGSPTLPGAFPRSTGAPTVRNVLLFVFESLPAHHLEAFGGRHRVSPRLESLAERSMRFTNIYAPCSYSPSALAALLLSLYPCISHRSLTRDHPGFTFPSLSGELERRGYRTAFFSSADVRFQKGDEFLAHRGFARVMDYRTFGCGRDILRYKPELPLLDGTDDACLAPPFVEWLDDSDGDSPFFAVLWTMMSHYPYFAPPEAADYRVGDARFNRYLKAVRRGDETLGRALDELEKRGMEESTLVVVVGDHGEAFGEHGHFAHGTNLYEENIHVPLILIHPRLFRGERNPVLGSLIDVAPTILDILGLPSPAGWQGRSLWSPVRSPRVYFSNAVDEYLVGYRQGDRKLIFNASWNRFEIYDLAEDPGETRNRAAELPDAVREGEQRLAAWMQFQRSLLERILSADR